MEQSSHFSWRYPLALAAVLVLSACGKAPETTQGMAAPKVSVAEVIEQPLNEWDEFTGRLEARSRWSCARGCRATSTAWPSMKAPW